MYKKLYLWLQCGPGGCLIELAEQLCIIMVGKQLINNAQEFVIPYVSPSEPDFSSNKSYLLKLHHKSFLYRRANHTVFELKDC